MIPFHKLLIRTAIVFSVGFSVWSYVWFRETRAPWALAIAAMFLVAAGALAYYLRHLKRFLDR